MLRLVHTGLNKARFTLVTVNEQISQPHSKSLFWSNYSKSSIVFCTYISCSLKSPIANSKNKALEINLFFSFYNNHKVTFPILLCLKAQS